MNHFGFYTCGEVDGTPSLNPLDFLNRNVYGIGSQIGDIEKLPKIVVVGTNKPLERYEGERLPIRYITKREVFRCKDGPRHFENSLFVDEKVLNNEFLWAGNRNMCLMIRLGWLMTFKIVRIYFTSSYLPIKALIPFQGLDTILGDQAQTEKEFLLNHFIKSKESTESLREHIDSHVISLACTSLVMAAYKANTTWDLPLICALLSITREDWEQNMTRPLHPKADADKLLL